MVSRRRRWLALAVALCMFGGYLAARSQRPRVYVCSMPDINLEV